MGGEDEDGTSGTSGDVGEDRANLQSVCSCGPDGVLIRGSVYDSWALRDASEKEYDRWHCGSRTSCGETVSW